MPQMRELPCYGSQLPNRFFQRTFCRHCSQRYGKNPVAGAPLSSLSLIPSAHFALKLCLLKRDAESQPEGACR
jgi:hypothetical protein